MHIQEHTDSGARKPENNNNPEHIIIGTPLFGSGLILFFQRKKEREFNRLEGNRYVRVLVLAPRKKYGTIQSPLFKGVLSAGNRHF